MTRLVLASLVAAGVLAPAARAAPIVFDFEDLPDTVVTPFSGSAHGVTASFSSPADPAAFFVGPSGGAYLTLTGNVVTDSYSEGDHLVIAFSQPINSATLDFATDPGGSLMAQATLAGASVAAVDQAGVVPGGFIFPEGILSIAGSFDTLTLFNPDTPSFAIDNLTLDAGSRTSVPEPSSLAVFGSMIAVLLGARRHASRRIRS